MRDNNFICYSGGGAKKRRLFESTKKVSKPQKPVVKSALAREELAKAAQAIYAEVKQSNSSTELFIFAFLRI